jgi:putative glycosyltransferase (TIGR04372 family)
MQTVAAPMPTDRLAPPADEALARRQPEGVSPWLRRLRRGLGLLAALPASLLLYAGLRLLNLVRPVRLGSLNAKGRLSTMVSYIEPYVRQLRLEGLWRAWVIVLNPGACPNAQLTAMYGRAVSLVDGRRRLLRYLLLVAHRFLSRGSAIHAPLRVGVHRDFARAWQEGQPVLRFTDEEMRRGRALLKELGIEGGSRYVCVGLRESAYYRQFLSAEAKRMARYENTEADPDTYIRNPSLAGVRPMAERLAREGLRVLRMGHTVGEPVPADWHPGVIDYASARRTAFGDIFLLAHCAFTVAAGAPALWLVAAAFNRPVIWTSSYTFDVRGLREGDLFIPCLFWLKEEHRFLRFREMLEAGARYTYASACRRDGVELVHNSPEEIDAVVGEMQRRLDGTWRPHPEDDALQQRLNALYRPEHLGYRLPGRIGAEFLRQHRDLLEDR